MTEVDSTTIEVCLSHRYHSTISTFAFKGYRGGRDNNNFRQGYNSEGNFNQGGGGGGRGFRGNYSRLLSSSIEMNVRSAKDEDKVVTVAEVLTVELRRSVPIAVAAVQHIKHSHSTFKSTDSLLKRMRQCAGFLLTRHILFICPLFSLLLFRFSILFKTVIFCGTI